MRKRTSTSKKEKDTNEIAFNILKKATKEGKSLAAVELGRLGGLKGGKARAAKLSAKRRREIASNAAQKRWLKNERRKKRIKI